MNGLYLFVRIAGTAVAIPASEVDAVVRLQNFSPVPGVAGHVAGLATLRSRVLTIIDAAELIACKAMSPSLCHFAVVCEVSGHSYGILVDEVIDICQVDGAPLPVRGRIDASWQRFAQGIILHGGHSHILASLGNFIENCNLAHAA
jgi:purine-binding chemotaxis protein CheW